MPASLRQALGPLAQRAGQALDQVLGGGGGEPLPVAVLTRVSALLGRDFSHVRVHRGGDAAKAAQGVSARAFTLGSHIYLGESAPDVGSSAGERVLLHELTHVIQHDEGRLPGGGDGLSMTQPGDASEGEAAAAEERAGAPTPEGAPPAAGRRAPEPPPRGGRVARLGLSDITNAAGRAWDATGGRVVRAAGDLAGEAVEAVVGRLAPGLMDLIRNGPEALLKRAIEPAVRGFVSSVTGGLNLGELAGQAASAFSEAWSVLQGAKAGDARCCEMLVQGINAIRQLAQAFMNNPVFTRIKGAFSAASDTIGKISKLVLAPAFDALKAVAGGVWEAVSGVARTVGGWLQTVRGYATQAFDWVAQRLGFPGGGGEGGLMEWLKGKASAVWDQIKQTLQPLIGPLKTVGGVLLALSPMGPLFLAVRYGPQIVEAVQWLWANRGNPDAARLNPQLLGGSILPKILSAGQGFVSAVKGAASWLTGKLGELAEGTMALLGGITGVPVLSMAQGAVQGLSRAAQGLATWAQETFSKVGDDLAGAYGKLADFIRPYKEVLCSVALAVANPAMIPAILTGWAWRWLPDCIKGPLIDLLLDALLAILEGLPNLAMFGPLWPLLKAGVLGFLRGLRAQPNQVKEKVSNKLARIISGASPAFLLGFVKGFLKGVWEGLTDPFVLIWTALKGLGSLVEWLSGLARGAAQEVQGQRAAGPAGQPEAGPQAAGGAAPGGAGGGLPGQAELAQRAGQMAGEIRPPVQTVTSGFMPAAREFFQGQGGGGMTLDGLIAKLGQLWQAMEGAIQRATAQMAQKVCEFMMQDGAEGQLGESVGWLAGTIAFEVVLGILTAGAWQPTSAALRALKAFARVLDWTGEALGAAFKLLGKIGGYLMDGVRSLGRLFQNAGGQIRKVLGAMGEIGEKLVAWADELLSRFGRGVAREGGERVTREGVEAATERTAREGMQEAGERTTREVGEEAGQRTTRETAQEGTEQAGEQGGRRADDVPDVTEKQRVAALARAAALSMEAAGQPISAVLAFLQTWKARYRWIQRFEAEPEGANSFEIWMVASRIRIGRYVDRALNRRFNRLAEINGVQVRGFRNAGEVMERAGNLRNRLQRLGLDDVQIGIRGSSVTGASSKGGAWRWFDETDQLGRSDVDFFFTSPKLEAMLDRSIYAQGGDLFVNGRLKPEVMTRLKPEIAAILEEFGQQTTAQIGRDANVILLRCNLVSSLESGTYAILR